MSYNPLTILTIKKKTVSCFVVIATIFSLLVSTSTANAHNIYSSFTSIDWNRSDNSLEIIMTLHGHELEARLSLDAGKRLSFLNDEDIPALEKLTKTYVMDNLMLAIDGVKQPLDYVGMEMKGQTVIIYVETEMNAAPDHFTFSNGILLDVLGNQVNTVIATVNGKRAGDDITREKPVIDLSFN